MPRSFNQKLKILYLMKLLQEKTDREHPVSVKDIIQTMEAYGISVERKTVYDDIETLRTFGMKIGSRRGKPAGFYLEERTFELPELKFLMDAVQSSKFITEKQSAALVRKLEDLASVHEAKKLKSQVFLMPGIKTLNEEIYTNIETIYDAISANRQISFRYYQWTLSRELKPKRGGERYRVSPGKLLWNNDNYYLVGYNDYFHTILHYRVDRMTEVRMTSHDKVEYMGEIDFDLKKHHKQLFGMYGGEEQKVTVQFDSSLIDVVIDKFGEDVDLIPRKDGTVRIETEVQVSPQFIAWVNSFENKMRVISPKKVVEQVKKAWLATSEQYNT